jgi:hypothetical protein
MQKKIPSYMRTHRRRWGLTQKELAHLLGSKSGTQVSRYERLLRQPKLYVALACQVIFGELPQSMFPKLYSQVEEGVMRRAYQLYQKLERGTSKASKRKLKLLRDMLRRATVKPNDNDL